MNNKRVLVTGGGTGIGKATALHLESLGAHVTICGRREEPLADTCKQGTGTGSLEYVTADVTIEDQIATAVDVASGESGLDGCFANAGGSSHLGSILNSELDAVQSTLNTNVIGTFLTLKHAAKAMKATDGGSIVVMSSGAGHFPHRHLWAYGASKAANETICKYAAEELGQFNIRVNAVQPGIIDDELMAFITAGGALLEDYLEQMPISRVGTVDDVASAVVFLLGDQSTWITGECLGIDGGHHLRRGANYELLFG